MKSSHRFKDRWIQLGKCVLCVGYRRREELAGVRFGRERVRCHVRGGISPHWIRKFELKDSSIIRLLVIHNVVIIIANIEENRWELWCHQERKEKLPQSIISVPRKLGTYSYSFCMQDNGSWCPNYWYDMYAVCMIDMRLTNDWIRDTLFDLDSTRTRVPRGTLTMNNER